MSVREHETTARSAASNLCGPAYPRYDDVAVIGGPKAAVAGRARVRRPLRPRLRRLLGLVGGPADLAIPAAFAGRRELLGPFELGRRLQPLHRRRVRFATAAIAAQRQLVVGVVHRVARRSTTPMMSAVRCYRCGREADPSSVERLETSPEFEWTQRLGDPKAAGITRSAGPRTRRRRQRPTRRGREPNGQPPPP